MAICCENCCESCQTGNHPFVVWSSCFLWIISLFTITDALLLMFCAGDVLACTGTDLINELVLLSDIVMLPTNLYIMFAIARNKNISHKGKVGIFPLWMCILLIIIINIAGTVLCVRRLLIGEKLVLMRISQSMASYRTGRNDQRFIDNLQWFLKCCGLNSYKDWFSQDWYDKSRDYVWEPSQRKRYLRNLALTDSVPLSCCKSGSCISNYLAELGTHSIHTRGCSHYVNRLIKIYVIVHMVLFMIVIIIEVLVLNFIIKRRKPKYSSGQSLNDYNVQHIMDVKDNFRPSSGSYVVGPTDESDEESSR